MSQYPIFAQNTVVIDAEQIKMFGNNSSSLTYNGSPILTGASNITLTPVGSAPNADAASVTAGALTLQPADATHPGLVVGSGAQTLGGTYTFSNTPVITSGVIAGPGGNLLQTGPAGSTLLLGNSGTSATVGNFNTGVGIGTLALATSAATATAVGAGALNHILTGINNEALGQLAGSAYTGAESNNVCISNPGTVGDNNVIRLGRPTFHTSCYVQGISGVTVAGAVAAVIGASGQLGTVVSSKKRKREIEPIDESVIKKAHLLKPTQFKMIDDHTNEQNYGLIAEDVEQVLPQMVVYSDPEKKVPATVQYHKLTPILLQIAQQHEKDLAQLKLDIASLQKAKSS
jgi:Chaperone of endosialidase